MKLPAGKKWFTWTRLAGLVVTVAMLLLVFRQIGSTAFLEALKQTQPVWVLAGLAAYGLAIWLASLRWHLALRLTDRAIHLTASSRLFLIGHFFYVVLFGAAGGDLAKSVAYGRYYRFRIPEVIAAAPLDRVLGVGGNLILGAIVGAIAVGSGGFEGIGSLNLHYPGIGSLSAMLAAVLAVAAVLFLWRPQGENFWAQTLRALRSGVARLFVTPSVAIPGTLFAFLSIATLSAVFAFNLRAVSQTALPWPRLLWTFPVITLISSIPITFAGTGLREAAALLFLGFYGVPPGECVAAALLTLGEKLAWGMIGAAVLWKEESLRERHGGGHLPRSVSIVIPTLNEADALPETIRCARANPEVIELIVVDGGSCDKTCQIAEEAGCRVFTTGPSRGGQMRLGASKATGDVVMLLYAGAWLPPHAAHAVLNCLRDDTVVGGGFWKRFHHTPLLLLGSRSKCALRLLLGRRIAGDQAMFVRRQILEQIGGIPDQPLMEDFELCRRLRKTGRLALADATIIASARHFKRLGVLRAYARICRATLSYHLSAPPRGLERLPERE